MAKEHGKSKKKLHLAALTHHFHDDGTVTHEHHYKNRKEDTHTLPPRMVGTSQDLEDAKQHLEDNWPSGGDQPQPGEGEGEDEGQGQQPEGGQPGQGEEEE